MQRSFAEAGWAVQLGESFFQLQTNTIVGWLCQGAIVLYWGLTQYINIHKQYVNPYQ